MDTTSPSASASGRSIGLRNWRVRSKLIAVLVIPAVAFLVLASFGIGALVGNAQAFEDGRKLAELGRQVTALVHELQAERDLSVAFTASADNTAVSKNVTLGNLFEGNMRVIKEGLSADDRVIVNGLMRARAGQKVTPQEAQASGAQAKSQ